VTLGAGFDAAQLPPWEEPLALSLALLDIDYFKLINDRFGHSVGDEVLIEVVQRFAAATLTGTAFTLARVGGEEFALLMPDTKATEAREIVVAGLEALRGTDFAQVGKVTASAGIAELVDDMNDDVLYRLADANLYKAKALGRDQVC
jgi:diguanylate cyclase (GGDEF)-like protein